MHVCFHVVRLPIKDYKTHLSRIATTLFEAMAKNLDLSLKPSEPYLAENTGMVRVYRYPNCSDANVGWGMEAHTDSSVLSILNQDDEVSGLQVLKDDQWLTVKPIPNTLIVNLGDMMQVQILFISMLLYFILIIIYHIFKYTFLFYFNFYVL